jgi:hypothetical protein
MKAARRTTSPYATAVVPKRYLHRNGTVSAATHARAVRISCEITQTQWWLMKRPGPAEVKLREILTALNEKKIRYVLTGAHAIGGWTGDPRATHDVDILVKGGRTHARAIKVIQELYPQLEMRMFAGVAAFFVPGDKRSVIDVTYPHRADIEETLAHPIWIDDAGLKYRIPSLEAALANKYGAMLALNRDITKRMQDAVDFMKMVQNSTEPDQQAIDLDRLRDLGERVWPGGGGDEILGLIELIKQGGAIDLSALYGNA